MIKKLFLALAVVLMATTAVAQTTLGQSCENPIPVDKSYVGVITEPGEYWFTAWSYDLPLNVHFSPDNANSIMSPEVYVDFTCTPGVYEDHKLDSVINGYSDFGLELPLEFLSDKVVINGKVEWDLSINENYRENLTSCGITHNVQAFVKVYFPESGKISLQPDLSYQSCMEKGKYVNLGDTFDIVANDEESVFVLPYSEWKKDSIQFTWLGEQSATIWVSDGDCDFTPTFTSVYVKDRYNVSKNAPYKLSSTQIESAVSDWLGGGVFFAKVTTRGNGKLVVEKIPLGPIQGDAVLLEHGKSVDLQANDERVFCFPKAWRSTEFLANTNYLMDMHVSNTSEFEIGDANVITKYTFSKDENNRKLQLSTADIATLAASATDDYVYVRFQCNTATTLTPTKWNVSLCADESILISSGNQFSVLAKSSSTLYRLNYQDWRGYDFSIKWTGASTLPTYFASACDFILSSADENVLQLTTISRRGTANITAAKSDLWVSRIEDNGFVYVRFNPSNAGKVTFTSTKPAEEDPEIITNPCVLNSIELKAGDQITLNLDSAFTIYRINYAEWVAKDNKLAWAGESQLHTFIAETCEFAVAPYNKYVVNYAVVPANGEYVLDVATLKQYADKVDADGYLYIRFLTEKEGTLSVTSY